VAAEQGAFYANHLSARGGSGASGEELLGQTIASFYDDPLGFVLFIFPWGEAGTALEDEDGPDVWQAQQMLRVADAIADDPQGYQIQEAISSGHGVGKSAEVAWMVLWAMSTRPDAAVVVTANTDTQLRTKTWKELAKWHNLSRNKHWFTWTATRLSHVDYPSTWFAAAIPNSEQNSEAFAGTHAKHVVVIFDEASSIPDALWEVTEGAMTTPMSMWFVYGNPTRNSGRFRQCFGEFKHRWQHNQVDARRCSKTDKKRIAQWQEDWGEDSDFFRVRVRGEFPRSGSSQLISADAIMDARKANLQLADYMFFPVIISVDVARFGADETVVTTRQGRKVHSQVPYRGLRNTQVGARAAERWREYKATGAQMSAIMVDGIGLGSGVVDYLHDAGYPVLDVNVGAAADSMDLYYNKRAECYMRMKDWFDSGGDIPDDPDLAGQLNALEYMYDTRERVRMEKKADMKARGLSSPDRADSLALSFAEHVMVEDGGSGGGASSFEPGYG